MISVVLDANVVISGTIAPKGSSARILDAWRADYLEVIACPALVDEIAEKLQLPRIRDKYSLTDELIQNTLLLFTQVALIVPGNIDVETPPPDPDDTMLFSAALEATADYIVTGDKALLNFEWKAGCPIVSPRPFLETEFPRQLAITLTYPVFAIEDLLGKGYHVVEVEGHECVALFTSSELADLYLRANNILAHVNLIGTPSELSNYLQTVLSSGCQFVAFNPVGDFSIFQPIDMALVALRQLEESE